MFQIQWSKPMIYIAIIVLAVLALFGAYVMYSGNNPFVPKVVPTPVVKPTPNDVWSPILPPTKNEVAGLKLPPPQEIKAGQKYVVLAAVCSKRVRWLISNQNQAAPVEAVESPLTNSVMIFPGSLETDVIVVVAYSADDNGNPTDPALTLIKVVGDTPAPPPGPAPKPVPKPEKQSTKLHVTFIIDPQKQTKAISDIVNNRELRQWLVASGNIVHEVSIHDALPKGVSEVISDFQPPILLLQSQAEPGIDEGIKRWAGQLVSVQQVKDMVSKYTGAK